MPLNKTTFKGKKKQCPHYTCKNKLPQSFSVKLLYLDFNYDKKLLHGEPFL